MAERTIDIPDEVQRRVTLRGKKGAAWVAGLAPLVATLERDWNLLVGRTLTDVLHGVSAWWDTFPGTAVSSLPCWALWHWTAFGH